LISTLLLMASHIPRRLRARLSVDRHLGAVILTILRTLQGIGVGGEWGGSVLISMNGRAATATAD